MADNKNARDKQADDEERRQRERELDEGRERADESEPSKELGDLDDALESHDYPMTTADLVRAHGDREVETRGGSKTLGEVLAPVDTESYQSVDDVRNRIQGLIRR